MKEKHFKRIICLVCDGLGVGEAPDAKLYGDEGSNTLLHICSSVGGLALPNFEKLGLGLLGNFKGIQAVKNPLGIVSRLSEKSAGKDTTTGHWELAGLVTTDAFTLYPQGFSEELLTEFIKEAKVTGTLGNRAASGTQIIEELGEEHLKTLKPIVYTSGDSVFQIAAHEEAFGLKRLYEVCEVARRITLPYKIGRVIARPFIGKTAKDFKRTERRKDFSIEPGKNALDLLKEKGVPVYSVGKIEDIFAHRGISFGNHTGNNPDSLQATMDYMVKNRGKESFIFTNLVDFDQLYGHRRDPKGYGNALLEMDAYLPKILSELTEDDCLMITADHGCDPTFKGSDHTREFVPLIAYSPNSRGEKLPDRNSFSDVAATLLEAFQLNPNLVDPSSQSFLCKLKN